MKTIQPKKLYIRKIENGRKISVGEYILVKWRNIINPFKITDTNEIEKLHQLIIEFRQNNKNREVVAILKTVDTDILKLVSDLGITTGF